MASGGDRPPFSSWLDTVASAGTTLRRRALSTLNRAPWPVRQAGRLIVRTVDDTFRDRVPGLAAEVALFSLISLPSLLIAVLGSLGFIAEALGPEGSTELHRLLLEAPSSFLSERTFQSYSRVVEAGLAQSRGSVISIGIVLSLWTGSRAVNRYLETITIAYGVEPRPAWRRRLLALALTVGGLIGAAAILPPLVFGPDLVAWVTPDPLTATTLRALDLLFWPVIALLILIGLVTLYHFGVPWRTPWRRDIPGALLAMALWLIASAGLRAYLSVSARDDAVYGQLAVPIAVVLWLYITAFAVLLGAEFNAEIEKMWPHEKHPWRLRRRAR
ncbi:ribonuclease BN [Mycolicibacterium elephantis]|uniref:YihY/virulence factor BrkB family protein n=1 Tax=Mycolicibacterium elephantis TaxID=81858 RepID=UPI0007E9745C|nr:YihY/virulence factor BrkB family protein [Mycolicibacterium elephantis]OBA65868.1 ribonuclease BN [Mycolicibacterium elephantis]